MGEGSDGKRQLGRIQLQRRPLFSHEPGVRESRAHGGLPAGLASAVVEQGGVSCVDLRRVVIALSVLSAVPVEQARERLILPLAIDDAYLYVAVADPTERTALDALGHQLGRGVKAYVALHGMLRDVLEAAYAARSAGASSHRGVLAGAARRVSLAWEEVPTSPRMLERGEISARPIELGSTSARAWRESDDERVTAVPLADESRTTAVPPDDEARVTTVPLAAPTWGGDSTELPMDDAGPMPNANVFDDEELSRPLAVLPSEPAAPTRIDPLAPSIEVAPARVLVVEARESERVRLAELLAASVLEVDAFGSGLDALQSVRERAPDVVVIDAGLADVDALDVCRRLKGSRRFGHIPIVLRSRGRGWRYAEDVRAVFGVDEVLEEGASHDAIVAAVERALTGTSGEPEPVRDSPAAAHLNAGIEAYAGGDLDAAIEQLEQGLEVDPQWSPLHYHLGLLYGQRKDVFEAFGSLERAAELSPRDFSTLKNLAVLYQRAGFRLQATSMWQRALLSAPDDDTRASIRNHLVSLL